MRYIDSGKRLPEQALGYWLERLDAVTELRIQTGFFRADALGIIGDLLNDLREKDGVTHVLVGSNEGLTPATDVRRLVEKVGLPRMRARVGIVSFSGAYFHPKVLHYRRADGTQGAYVGSANLTGSGVTALHVEAGLLLDTREGDIPDVLDGIAQAIDVWFHGERAGFEEVAESGGVDRLVEAGILAPAPPPHPRQPSAGENDRGQGRPRLYPLITVPGLGGGEEPEEPQAEPRRPAAPPRRTRPAAPRPGFPPYLLFDPGAQEPTRGVEALTGIPLPGNAAGLIIRLSRDSARHFFGGSGTSNITLPVPAVPTLRFGLFRRQYDRPRAEFALQMRILADAGEIATHQASTNVMAYGVVAGESGHRDVRILVPAQARRLAEAAGERDWPLPQPEDFALLEWPSEGDPVFRLSFLVPGSALATRVAGYYEVAERAGELMGRGACLLPDGVAPIW